MEPVQLAVRSLIERATVEMMANLYGAPGPEVCLDAANDPLGTVGPTGGYYPAYANTDTNNGQPAPIRLAGMLAATVMCAAAATEAAAQTPPGRRDRPERTAAARRRHRRPDPERRSTRRIR